MTNEVLRNRRQYAIDTLAGETVAAPAYHGTDMETVYRVADALRDEMEARPCEWFTASRLSRYAKVRKSTPRRSDVWLVLDWMVENDFVRTTGNGCWTKYGFRG